MESTLYTSTTFSYSARETFAPMDPNGHKHILVWQDLGWELYNRTAGDESTSMKNDNNQIQFSDSFQQHTHAQFITFQDAHTQKCTVRGWRLHSNNIFLLCPRTILSSWLQWSQTQPGLQGLGWELYTRTTGNGSTPMKKDEIRLNSVTDSIDTPTQFITFHDAHTHTKVHCSGMTSTLPTTFSYSAQELFSPVDHNGHKHILVCRVLVGNYTTGQQGMKVPLCPMKNYDIRYHSVTDSIDTPTQFITFHDGQTYSEYCITFTAWQTDKLTDGQLYNI